MLSVAKHLQYLLENDPMQILRFALPKVTPDTSFPRRRESTPSGMDPRMRGGDGGLSFGWVGRGPMHTQDDSREDSSRSLFSQYGDAKPSLHPLPWS